MHISAPCANIRQCKLALPLFLCSADNQRKSTRLNIGHKIIFEIAFYLKTFSG